MILAGLSRPQMILRDNGAYIDGVYVSNYETLYIRALVVKINDNYMNVTPTEEGQIADRPRVKLYTNTELNFNNENKTDKLVWGGYIWNMTGFEMFEHPIRGTFHKEYEFTRTDLKYEEAMNFGGSS